MLSEIYRPILTMLTDLYQLTMAYGYWKNGKTEHETVFHLFFRKNPFEGAYAIAAGLEQALDLVEQATFTESDIAYLQTLTGNDGAPLFEQDFIDYLGNLSFNIDIDAIPEGTVAFAHEPLLRIQGPVIPCQLFETSLLNIINFQTLIATKSSRLCTAVGNSQVLEFGLRRAQGVDGALSARRAAYIGGCSATSNVLAAEQLRALGESIGASIMPIRRPLAKKVHWQKPRPHSLVKPLEITNEQHYSLSP